MPCVYLLGRPQLLFQYVCMYVCIYVYIGEILQNIRTGSSPDGFEYTHMLFVVIFRFRFGRCSYLEPTIL